jgi:hypothetical protein
MSEQVLEFPQGPTDGQTITWSFEHTGGSAENNIMTRVWSWNDFRSAWISNKSKSSGLGIRDELAVGPSAAQLFVLKSGDTMHGMLTVPILQATGDAGIVRGKLGEFSSGNITALTGNTAFFNQGRFRDSLTVDSSGGLSAALGNFSASLTASSFFSSTANITTANITTANITTANITTANIETVTANVGFIGTITGTNSSFSGLTATNGFIGTLTGTNSSFTGLTATNGFIGTLTGTNANFSSSLTAYRAFRIDTTEDNFIDQEFITKKWFISLSSSALTQTVQQETNIPITVFPYRPGAVLLNSFTFPMNRTVIREGVTVNGIFSGEQILIYEFGDIRQKFFDINAFYSGNRACNRQNPQAVGTRYIWQGTPGIPNGLGVAGYSYRIPILNSGNFKNLHTAKFNYDTAYRVTTGSSSLNNVNMPSSFDIPNNSASFPQFSSQYGGNTISANQRNHTISGGIGNPGGIFSIWGNIGYVGCQGLYGNDVTGWQPWSPAPIGPNLTIICRT